MSGPKWPRFICLTKYQIFTGKFMQLYWGFKGLANMSSTKDFPFIFFPAFHARLLLLEYHTRFYGTRKQGYRYIDSCTLNETMIYLNIVCVRCIRNHTLINNNWLINILILRNFFVLTHFHMIVTFHICWSRKKLFHNRKKQCVIGYGNIWFYVEQWILKLSINIFTHYNDVHVRIIRFHILKIGPCFNFYDKIESISKMFLLSIQWLPSEDMMQFESVKMALHRVSFVSRLFVW